MMPEGESRKQEFLEAVDRKFERGKELTRAAQAAMINAVSAQVNPDSPSLDTPEKVGAVVGGFYGAAAGVIEQRTGITYTSGGDFDDYRNAVLRTIGIVDEDTIRAVAKESPLAVIANAANTQKADAGFAQSAIYRAAQDNRADVEKVLKSYVSQSPSLTLTGDVNTMPEETLAGLVLALHVGGPAVGDTAKALAKDASGWLKYTAPAYRD